ncbi:MAG: efflux RND transporter periplasmic adaptor subunit [Balneolales bacterium]
MKIKYYIGGLVVIILLGAWLAVDTESSESNMMYVSPSEGLFDVSITTSGELRAETSTSIRGPENMRNYRINNVPILRLVPEGTVVEKGDFVAELDRSSVLSTLQDAELDLEEEETQLEQAQLDSALTLSQARYDILDLEYNLEERKIAVEQAEYESPAVQRQADIALEQAERQLEQAKSRYVTTVMQAEANLRRRQNEVQEERYDVERITEIMERFEIRAPENGMVIYRRNDDGSKVKEGSTIYGWNPIVAELPDFSVMESVTYINEVDINKIKLQQPVSIGLDANPDKILSGIVTEVTNIGEQRPNSNSKVFEVVIRVSEPDSTLRPAMTTSNTIQVNSADHALFVPLETVFTQDSMMVVYKRGARPVMQQVVLGLMNENEVVILEGVDRNDQLFLTRPPDTSNINKSYLSEEILQKYREQEENEEVIIRQPDSDERHPEGGQEDIHLEED